MLRTKEENDVTVRLMLVFMSTFDACCDLILWNAVLVTYGRLNMAIANTDCIWCIRCAI